MRQWLIHLKYIDTLKLEELVTSNWDPEIWYRICPFGIWLFCRFGVCDGVGGRGGGGGVHRGVECPEEICVCISHINMHACTRAHTHTHLKHESPPVNSAPRLIPPASSYLCDVINEYPLIWKKSYVIMSEGSNKSWNNKTRNGCCHVGNSHQNT